VEIRTDVGTVTTDASGRYEIRSSRSTVGGLSLRPADGYEGRASGLGTLTPGQRDFVARRIVRFTISPPPTIPVSDGTLWYSVLPRVLFGTGEEERVTGSQGDEVVLTCSNSTILRCRRDGGQPVIEGLSPGTASVTGEYWGVRSADASVRVGQ
jgi:hypothetical protein